MIPFLVKLANLLDKRGQYAMAREVDDLVIKLAQQIVVSPTAWAQQQAKLRKLFTIRDQMLVNPQANAKKIKQLEDQIRQFNASASKRDAICFSGQDRRPLNQEEQAAWNNAGKPEGNEFVTWYDSYQAEKQRQEAVAAKKPARKNPQIIQIQKNLGVKQTGIWDSTTNKAFIAAMNSLPAYAKMMQGGKFNGTLQDAVRYTTQLNTYNELNTDAKDEDGTPTAEDFTPSKAPAYKSHYDLLDIQDTIRKLVAAGYGESIQALIGIAENAADKMKVPPGAEGLTMKQDGFEKYFNQRARMYI